MYITTPLYLVSCILYPVGIMAAAEALKIISVTGAHSGVGKTTICSILLENLKGFGAVKYTKASLHSSVTEDKKILGEPGKDTAIYLASGADRVVWVQSTGGEGLKEAINIAMTKMKGLKGVLIEGNSPLEFLKPDLVIFIIQEDGRIKASAVNAGKKAHVIIINSERQVKDVTISSEILQNNAKVFAIDLINKKGEIDKFLAYIKEYIKLTGEGNQSGCFLQV